jgi:signal transduction histidine kinase
MLTEFLATNHDEIIARTRAKVASRSTPPPSEDELKNGVPLFLRQLVDRLSLTTSDNDAIEGSAAKHGGELQKIGLSVGQVVHGYGDVCQAITELATAMNAPITADEFHTFNRCLDDAIAEAVTEYVRRRDRSLVREGSERLGALAHDLRKEIAAAILSFNLLKKGNVALGGSTGALLGRSLRGLRDLVNESLTELRLESGIQQRQHVSLFETLGDVEIEASIDASVRGIALTVTPGERGVDVDVDPHFLAAAIAGLLRTAFELACSGGHVVLRGTATADRALIEVEDDRGASSPGEPEEHSPPPAPRASNGAGIDLSSCRKSVAACGGELRVRALPGHGCVFTIDLPRHSARPSATQAIETQRSVPTASRSPRA